MKYLKVNESSSNNEGIIELTLSNPFYQLNPETYIQGGPEPSIVQAVYYKLIQRPYYQKIFPGATYTFINPILFNWTLEFWIKCKFDPAETNEKTIFEYTVFQPVATSTDTSTETSETTVENPSNTDIGLSETITPIMKIYFSPTDNHSYVFEINGVKKIIDISYMDNKWNHVALVQAGDTSVIFYLNGNPIVGKNLKPDKDLTYMFNSMIFHVYSNKNTVYIANINVSDAPRYNKYFNPLKLSPNSYGLGIVEESIDPIRTLKTTHKSTKEDNMIYFPFQESLSLEEDKEVILKDMSWTPTSFSSSGIDLDDSVIDYQVNSSELGYYNLNDIDYNLIYGRKFSITTNRTGFYCLKSTTKTINLLREFDNKDGDPNPGFTMDCFFKMIYNQDPNSSESHFYGLFGLLNIADTSTPISWTQFISRDEAYEPSLAKLIATKNISKFEYNKVYHYAMTYTDGVWKHYLNGKLILVESKVLIDTDLSLMIAPIGVYETAYSPIHTMELYLSHFRFTSKVLWESDFEPAQELFEYSSEEENSTLPTMFTDTTNNTEDSSLNNNIALLYPILSTAGDDKLYNRSYNNSAGYTFRPEYDSTTKIKIDNKFMANTYNPPSQWSTYPAITTDTYNSLYNYIKFIANKPILGKFTVEFWVYIDIKDNNATYRDLAYFSGRDSFFGIQVNGHGLFTVVYSKKNRYSVNFNTMINSDKHEQVFTKACPNQWVHIAFVHNNDDIADGLLEFHPLSVYVDGDLLITYADWVDNSLLRLFLTTGDSDSTIIPYYTGLMVTTDAKYTGQKIEGIGN